MIKTELYVYSKSLVYNDNSQKLNILKHYKKFYKKEIISYNKYFNYTDKSKPFNKQNNPEIVVTYKKQRYVSNNNRYYDENHSAYYFDQKTSVRNNDYELGLVSVSVYLNPLLDD